MSKRKIEDVIKELFTDDVHKNASDFVAYLRANDVTIDDSDNNFWDGKYEGVVLCTINPNLSDEYGMCFDTFMEPPRSWTTPIDPDNNHNMIFPADERTKEIVWANIRPCDPTCGGECSPGKRVVILGKAFDNLCKCILGIYNPDAETVECMKKMVAGRKSDILNKS